MAKKLSRAKWTRSWYKRERTGDYRRSTDGAVSSRPDGSIKRYEKNYGHVYSGDRPSHKNQVFSEKKKKFIKLK